MTTSHPSAHRRYKHVVFDPRGSRGRILDFAPRAAVRRSRFTFSPFDITKNLHLLPRRESRLGSLDATEESFVLWLFEQAGINGRAFRAETLRRRMSACLRVLRVENVLQARLLLMRKPELLQLAVGALVIGVTSFFRDADVFDHLTYSALSAFSRPASPRRIWSVGCSEGAELYSVAIVLAEMELLSGAVLLGSDCRSEAIKAARDGCYSAAAIKTVPTPWREKYFTEDSGRWRISDALRAATQWRRGDVTQVQEPGTWDVILCRNMAMYLRPAVTNRLWEQLELGLRPGGFLVLGKAERPLGSSRLSAVAPCIYRRDRG